MTDNINNGGPAFPIVIEEDGCLTQVFYGMTLRDWFAGQALAGLVADSNCDGRPEVYAKASYAMADAMLEARK